MKHLRRQALLAVTLISLCPLRTPAETKHSKTAQPPAVLAEDASWRQQLATWRSQREHELAAPDGWLTLVGLEWLKPGVNSFGAAQDNQIKIRAQAPPHIG